MRNEIIFAFCFNDFPFLLNVFRFTIKITSCPDFERRFAFVAFKFDFTAFEDIEFFFGFRDNNQAFLCEQIREKLRGDVRLFNALDKVFCRRFDLLVFFCLSLGKLRNLFEVGSRCGSCLNLGEEFLKSGHFPSLCG
ncbi:hypothetical protein A8F54_04200 [Burkholderia cenocepacia]|nr:hypothetical protein A8F54_40685 [Burkholderia cenocepacia]OOA44051.1 hypothetical protein A8F54_04200 [Burkholderia cenocepacia]